MTVEGDERSKRLNPYLRTSFMAKEVTETRCAIESCRKKLTTAWREQKPKARVCEGCYNNKSITPIYACQLKPEALGIPADTDWGGEAAPSAGYVSVETRFA